MPVVAKNRATARPASLLPDTIEPEHFLRAAIEPDADAGEVLTEQSVLRALLEHDTEKAVTELMKSALGR